MRITLGSEAQTDQMLAALREAFEEIGIAAEGAQDEKSAFIEADDQEKRISRSL